jgi:RNA polymerase sigma factor (sigma-70 family)
VDAENHIELLADRAFLDKLYGWAYHRCDSAGEAEDLTSEIVLAVLKALRRGAPVESFYAFAWTVARRVYADYSEKRRTRRELVPFTGGEPRAAADPIGEYIAAEAERAELGAIRREISRLTKIYRDVTVLYYLDGLPVADIAGRLGVSVSAVKQRLFSARELIRKGVTNMENEGNLVLKPVRLSIVGTGNPVGNDPRTENSSPTS